MINLNYGDSTPLAHVAINKSRLKMYNKDSKTPVFYLQKGQEFQLELYNPTKSSILARIFLNGTAISQAGLVLRPGERVFLERYIDIPKNFLFDTYEVEDTLEIKNAIENNGDLMVDFYKEFTKQPNSYNNLNLTNIDYFSKIGTTYDDSFYGATSFNPTNNLNTSITKLLNSNITPEFSCRNTIETGRIEKGSLSKQSLTEVEMSFDYFPFHTIQYKLLPLSQKVNTTDDIKVKRYCTNCGAKLGPKHKFCSNCGSKV